jgi:hypothetical protein
LAFSNLRNWWLTANWWCDLNWSYYFHKHYLSKFWLNSNCFSKIE